MILSKTKLKNISNYYFTVILTFLFVFGIPFTFLPVNSSKLVFLFLIGLLFLRPASACKLNTKFEKNIFVFMLMLLFMLTVSLIYTAGHNSMDFSIPYAYFIFLIEALLGSYLLYNLFLKNYSFEKILHVLVVISLAQALIIIGMFTIEPFRNLVFSIQPGIALELYERYGGFRGFGLAGSVTYDLAVFLSIGMMFIAYLISQSSKNRLFYLIGWVVIFMAVLMTGRTGWIGAFLSILILFLNFKNKNSIKSIVYLFFSIAVTSIILIYILFKFFPEIYETLFTSVIPYAFEMFINLYETGSLSTRSSDHLQTMYFDVSEKTLLWGDGYWVSPDGKGYYMNTDAGYMRHVLFYGIFPSLLLYLLYLLGFFKIIYSAKHTFNNLILFLMLCGYFFLAHYKGDFLTGSAMNIKLFTILFVFMSMEKYSLRRKIINEKNIIFS